MAISDFGLQKLSKQLRVKINLPRENDAFLRVIIEHNGLGVERIISKVNHHNGPIHRKIGLIPSIATKLSREAILEFTKMMGVIKIWEDTPVYSLQNQTGSSPDARQLTGPASIIDAAQFICAPQFICAHRAHETGYTGKGVVVALLDTGIYPHEDLSNPDNRILAWNDLLRQQPFPYDDHGHGTHIAGIIAGNGGSNSGKYGGIAPEARLVGIKVLDQEGMGWLSDLLAGLEWCLHHLTTLNIKVINLSLGTTAQAGFLLDPLCRATTKLAQQGVTICAANGSEAIQPDGYLNSPGMNPYVINVGNFNDQKTLTGDEILRFETPTSGLDSYPPDLVTPDVEITSLKTGGGYWTLSGASTAAPWVSGAVALILQKWPGANPEWIKWLLKKTARDLGLGFNLQGAGRLNLERIFPPAHKKVKKPEAPAHAYPEILRVLLNLIGSNLSHIGDSSPSGNLLSNLLLSFLKNLK